MRLGYPATIELPGHSDDPSVANRVHALPIEATTASAIVVPEAVMVLNDQDSDANGIDDTLHVVLASPCADFDDGPFVAITFDCREGAPRPTVNEFSCWVVGAADPVLADVGPESTCRLEVEARP